MNDPVTMTLYKTTINTPLGPLLALASDDALCVLHMVGAKHAPKQALVDLEEKTNHRLFVQLRRELSEYFAGTRQVFETRLAPSGTLFQRAAWNALTKIPYGTTCTYGAQALALNNPGAVRAVGAANGRNPIGILIPCHRVVGAGGALTGYAGGVDKKAMLLELEANHQGSEVIGEPRVTKMVAAKRALRRIRTA
jgi:methylated-DNA-[protein]-cysteine S-methyltransferase